MPKIKTDSAAKTGSKAQAEPAAQLVDFLCFSVYATNLAFGRIYKPLLDSLGLTYLQYVVLIALHEEDGQTVGSLGDKLFLESSTLTPLLKRMETAGFITRERDPADERQVRISLTAEGRKTRTKAFEGRMDIVRACALPPDEFAQLQKKLCKLRDNLLDASE